MSDPRVGLAVIARDEAATLPTLLASVEGAFDQVVLVDTGSTDDTTAIFRRWAGEETRRAAAAGRVFMHTLKSYTWTDDFAAARQFADSLFHPSIEWLSWADCDDELHGAQLLRQLAAQAPEGLAAYICGYDYAQVDGQTVCYLRRERLVRRGRGHWEGRVHEAQHITSGAVSSVDPALVEWRHRKPPADAGTSNERNLRILRDWVKQEPENARVLMYLGTEELARGRHRPAIRWLRRYLKLTTTWDEERAQVHRKLAIALLEQGDVQGAIRAAMDAVQVMPEWPDSYLTLAEAHYQLREPGKAIHHARRVLELGVPDTLLIINPLEYSVTPRVVMAAAYGALGQLDDAVAHADTVLAVQPGHPVLQPAAAGWRAQLKREHTADTFLACAEMLVAHDEQLKALDVMRSVPHYAVDHPRVVALRSQLRERIDPLFNPAGYQAHYETGGSKPEDMVPDDQVLELGDALPRCRFLLEGLQEQAGELAA